MLIVSKNLNSSVHIKMNNCLGGKWGEGRGRWERDSVGVCFEAVKVFGVIYFWTTVFFPADLHEL